MIDGGSKDWAKVPGSPPEMITIIIIFVMITIIIIVIKTTIDYLVAMMLIVISEFIC